MKTEVFALVPDHGWMMVDEVVGNESHGEPWFIGVGRGFDVFRLLVYASDETSAEEVAEEEFPEVMGQEASDEEIDEAESEGRDWFCSKDKRWIREEDIRIFTEPERVERGVVEHGKAKLKTWPGEVVEYT